jgi:hypothetical protein
MRQNTSNFDVIQSRLIGVNYLQTNSDIAEVAGTAGTPAWGAPTKTLSLTGLASRWNASASNYVNEVFARAPSFMDVVCYTGTGSNTTFAHNLGVAPEWMMVKSRSDAGTVWTVWTTYMASLNAASGIYLNGDGERFTTASNFNSTSPTSAVFTVGTNSETNTSASTYVNYLFATCAGVSKVGNFTGTGALQTINCGFTSGARFVLIKRISSGGGNWFVWDSARGISSGDDPYLILNNTPSEVTNTNYVDTTSVGFQVTAAASTTVNVSGSLYIFLAIA